MSRLIEFEKENLSVLQENFIRDNELLWEAYLLKEFKQCSKDYSATYSL